MSEFCPIIKKGGAFDAFAKKYHISEGELKASIRKVGIGNPALQEVSEDELLNSTEFRKLASNHYGINPSGWITSNKEHFEDVNAEFSDFKRTLSDNVQWIDDNTIYFKRDEIDQDDIDDIEYIEGIIGHENVFNRETYDGVVISFSLPRYVKKDSLANIDWARTAQNGYEVSSRGDNRFSALYARFNKDTIIDAVDVGGMTIEDVYQYVIKKSGKGKAAAMDSILNHNHGLRREDYEFLHTLPDDLSSAIINDSIGEKPATKEQLEDYYYYRGYLPLWQEWAKQNPELIEELRVKAAGKTLTDYFADTRVSQARALADILNSTNIGLKEPQSISEKQDEPATEISQKVDEWKEATDLLHKIKDTLGKRVRKSDNFKKDHTYYILNPQTGTWEKAQTSVSAIAENVYKRGVWGRSEDDMSFDINQPDENNPAIRLGKDFDRFARDYFSKKV